MSRSAIRHVGLALLVLASCVSSAPTLLNGDCELPYTGGYAYVVPTSWSGTGGDGVGAGAGFGGSPHTGHQWCYFQTTGNTAPQHISQVVTGFAPGGLYRFNFYVSYRSGYSIGGLTYSFLVDGVVKLGPSTPPAPWTLASATFTATSTSHTLEILSENSLSFSDSTTYVDSMTLEELTTFCCSEVYSECSSIHSTCSDISNQQTTMAAACSADSSLCDIKNYGQQLLTICNSIASNCDTLIAGC